MEKEISPLSMMQALVQKGSDFFGLSFGLITVIFAIRLIIDTSYRMAYPFVPQISEGLNLSISAFSLILSIRASSGLLGPIFGTLADRHGRRTVMTSALIFQSIGMAGTALSTGWWSLVPLFFVGLTGMAFFPAQQAYVSDQVPFEKRGRTLAFIETSFAISGILLLPLIGWMFDAWGWQMPFWILSGLSLFGAVVLWMQLPKSETRTQTNIQGNLVGILFRRKGVQAAMGVAFLLFIAVSIFMTFWGIWLSQEFGLDAVGLGLTATIISVGELTGSISSGLFIDRIGKRRGVIAGLFLGGVLFLLIPIIGRTLISIQAALVATIIMLEFTIVSLFSLYGEQAPEARATVFSLTALGTAAGFAVGPTLAANLWVWKGAYPIAVVGAICIFAAGTLVWRFLFEDGSGGEKRGYEISPDEF